MMTNTITHEGVEYRKVSRKAEIGELIVITGKSGTDGSWYRDKIGGIYSVIDAEDYGFEHSKYTYVDNNPSRAKISYVEDTDYLVLEQAEPTPVEASPTVIELLANISRRLYEVEESLKPKYYEEDAQDNSQSVFPNIPRFEMSDLNGKLLRIYTNTDVDGIIKSEITVGIDEENGVMYVLNSKSEVLTHG